MSLTRMVLKRLGCFPLLEELADVFLVSALLFAPHSLPLVEGHPLYILKGAILAFCIVPPNGIDGRN